MKTTTIAIIAASTAVVSAVNLSERAQNYLLKQQWEQFKVTYDRKYSANEEQARFEVFVSNMERSAVYQKEDPTARFGVTKFSDLTEEEFKAMYLTYSNKGAADIAVRANAERATTSPQTFSWANAITPIKDQGQCGSCWAFSVVETVESASFLAGNPLQELSTQALVSCDSDCYGCSGCWSYTAFDWIIAEGGVPTIESYPYTSGVTTVDGTCQAWTPAAFTQVASYEYATTPCTMGKCLSQDKNQVAQVLSTTQPLSVCVDASKWSHYTGGIMTDASCSASSRNQDHCVQLTGFTNFDGTSDNYWVVRNQWGESWGENGYIYLSTSTSNGNTCGVLNTPILVNMA